MGWNIEDFNPFRAEGQGSRVQWAVQMGYLLPNDTEHAGLTRRVARLLPMITIKG